MKRLFSLALTCLFLPFTVSAAQTWANDGSPATVVELFTSEGCSSCPPADRVLGSLKEESGLWEEVIPLAFHVDYWDYLGWKDRFARTEFSVRQRNKVREGKAKGTYTPGWFVNGHEWTGFFSRKPVPTGVGNPSGKLEATLDNATLSIKYVPDTSARHHSLTAHIALLAMNQVTEIKRGENRGKSLTHDFVVIDFARLPSSGQTWTHAIPGGVKADALAVWLTPGETGSPIQTVAGWIASK